MFGTGESKCYAVCYHCYLTPFLPVHDWAQLFATASDCKCEMAAVGDRQQKQDQNRSQSEVLAKVAYLAALLQQLKILKN